MYVDVMQARELKTISHATNSSRDIIIDIRKKLLVTASRGEFSENLTIEVISISGHTQSA